MCCIPLWAQAVLYASCTEVGCGVCGAASNFEIDTWMDRHHELDQKAACWFQWFDRLDHESGMSSKAEGLGDASKQRGQWQAMTSYLNWGCVAHQHHQPGVYVGSKRITKASNVWHVRCHCVYMGKNESKTCWSSLSRIGVDAGLKHTGGILSM